MTTMQFDGCEVEITHPDKVLFPEIGLTKLDLARYYQRAANTLLPHLRDRPLMMHRFPEGILGEGFYQKQIGDYFPEWVERINVPKEGGSTTHVVCNRAATIVYLANLGCVTVHRWLSRTDHLHHPDQLVLDLDPPNGEFEPVRFAAGKLHELLTELELPHYLQTTGSRGLHVVIPLDRSGDFDEARKWARDLAALLARREPDRLTVEQRKNRRRGRLYLDTGRNAYAQTAVSPYSVRALEGAPVATPLDWDELKDPDLDSQSYTIRNIFRRLGQKEDPWKAIHQEGIPVAMARERLTALVSS